MGTPRFEITDDDEPRPPVRSAPKPMPPYVPRHRRVATQAFSPVGRTVKPDAYREARVRASQTPTVNPLTLPSAAPVSPDLEDLPALVVDETKKRVRSGEAKVRVSDGLAAQTILERRAERAEDKQFMLNLARALAGGGASGPIPVLGPGPSEDEIEGEFEELPTDDDMSLAPAHLRQTVE